ncbi:MAG: UDP-N-acetylglucosamine 2-epimerase (non-hydrolyzing) [Acidimicrobiales bacterium]
MKVVTVLGTRPEIIRLSRVMARLESTPGIEHVLVHTGQNYDYELNGVFFEDLEVRQPDYFLEVSRESVGKAYGDIISKSEEVFAKEKPDAVLILGDTNSAIAAIIAKRMHIPVFHMEAGNRSFDHNVPEEVNRKIVDHTSDINLVYTEHARRHLLAEGKPHREIMVTGSPMLEVLLHQQPKIDASTATTDLGLEVGKFFVVSAHREENVDNPARLDKLIAALQRMRTEFDMPVVVSLHPRTKNRLESLSEADREGIIFHPPFGFSDYLRLQLDSACVLSDSGTIAEESSMLGFPAVTLRDSIERPEALDTGSIIMCGLDPDDVALAVRARMSDERQCPSIPQDYQITDTSLRVRNAIISTAPRLAFWHSLHGR